MDPNGDCGREKAEPSSSKDVSITRGCGRPFGHYGQNISKVIKNLNELDLFIFFSV
jgi:hypothetical protein